MVIDIYDDWWLIDDWLMMIDIYVNILKNEAVLLNEPAFTKYNPNNNYF